MMEICQTRPVTSIASLITEVESLATTLSTLPPGHPDCLGLVIRISELDGLLLESRATNPRDLAAKLRLLATLLETAEAGDFVEALAVACMIDAERMQ